MFEAATSTAIGCAVNLVANLIVLPRLGFQVGLVDNLLLTGIYTGISFVRSYAVRRYFQRRKH